MKNLFGGGSAPKKPDPVQQKKITEAKSELEKEQAKEKLEKFLKTTDDKMDKTNKEIEQLEREVKQHIMDKRKDKATIVLKKIKQKKEVLLKCQKQSTMMHKQMALMEDTEQDMGLFDAIKSANAVNQKNRDQQEQLQDELMKAKELDQESKMRRDELNELMDDDEDQDEIDDMLKEYEQQAADEMKLGFKDADKTIIDKKAQTQTGQTQPAQKQKDNNFDSLMAELMN